MFGEYLKERRISIYSLAKTSGVPYSTLNDLANGKVSIDNCKVGLLRKLSSDLGISMEELCMKCESMGAPLVNAYGTDLKVQVRNKSYYVLFEHLGFPVSIELCKVNRDSSFYINDIARWRSESYIREKRMENFR